MEISSNTACTMAKLIELGYRLTNVYMDGAVRMSNGTVGVFVRDLNVTPPHTIETRLEQAKLHDAGITVRFLPGGIQDEEAQKRASQDSLSEFLGWEGEDNLHAQNRDRMEAESAWQ